MTIDEAIRHCEEVAERYERMEDSHDDKLKEECLQCASDHRQLAEWLTELKQWRRVYGVCPSYEMCIPECREGYDAQIAEYKRLLKAAVEDFELIGEVKRQPKGTIHPRHLEYIRVIDVLDYKWRYADEALKLLGGNENG